MVYLKIGCVLLVVLALVCGTHYYLARCICHCVRHFFPAVRLIYVILALCVLTAAMVLSVARPFHGVLQRVISVIGVFWMGLFAYLLLYFLAADAVSLIARLIPSAPQNLMLFARLGAIGLAVLTVGYGFFHANRIQTVNYSVQLTEQPDSQMRVVMLSDLHIGAVNSEARLEKVISCINEEGADLVCIAGDIFDNSYSAILYPEKVIESLKKINATYGVYACLGNHDSGGEFDKLPAFLEQAGIEVLMDEYVIIDGRLTLAGRLDPSPIGGYKGKKRQPLTAVLSGIDDTLPLVVLDHNPASIKEYSGEGLLVLSGHTHKGQIFPGGLVTNAMYTVDYGYYKADNSAQMIVSSGAGTWGLPIRVGTDCEIVSIDLKL